jgi:hypothetical protein
MQRLTVFNKVILAGYFAGTAVIALALLCAAAQSVAATGADSTQVVFERGASSSGWIDFTPHTNLGIYLPVKIDGHESLAWLWGGPSGIDRSFAESIGLKAAPGAPDPIAGFELQAGDLTLHNARAKPDDLQAQAYTKFIGGPLNFRLGEEVFERLIVDIDFPHHRVAFRDPRTAIKPVGAIEIPLRELDGERVIPLSIDGAAPAQFELELGNMNGPLMVSPAYAQAQRLLEGHRTSDRLSGPYDETVVSVDSLRFAGVDFAHAPIALIPDTQAPPASIAGGVGLPLLARFRLIIDYSRNRLYAVPDATAASTTLDRDRIGFMLVKKDQDIVVAFVAHDSPAAAAGFKKGEQIAKIDGKASGDWLPADIIEFQMADAGVVHVFTMADGTTRQIAAADFF